MQLYHPRHKTAHGALQWLFLRLRPLNRPRYQTDKSSYNTTCVTLEGIHAPGRPPAHTRYHRHAGRCTGQRSRPIIIRYVRGCSISQTTQSRRGQLLPSADRWQVLARCQQYRPGAPADGSAPPPVQGQPGGLQSGTGQQSGRTG